MADSTVPASTRIVPIMARRNTGARSADRSARTSPRNSTSGADDVEGRLKDRLQRLNCYAAEIRGDGNCLFYSLSDQLYGTSERHEEVRQKLVDHIRTNRDSFIHFVDLGPERARSSREASRQANKSFCGVGATPSTDRISAKFEEMLAKMGESREWGGAFELQAFCQAYVKDIMVYQADSVQEFTSNTHEADPHRETIHLAYHEYQHYSSVRRLDGPRDGSPNLPRRLQELKVEDQAVKEDRKNVEVGKQQSVGTQTTTPTPLTLAEPWKISTIAEALPGFDYNTIRAMLTKCRGDIDFAFSRLLDDESPSSSQSSVVPTIETEAAGPADVLTGSLKNPATRACLGSSSRSSSRHSTGSKRAVDLSDDDEEGPIRSATRPRLARGRKRRILQDVTVGISVGGDNDDDVISIRLRVDSEAAVEPLQKSCTPQEDTEEETSEAPSYEETEREGSTEDPNVESSDSTWVDELYCATMTPSEERDS